MERFKKIINKQLGEVLVERGIITHEQLMLCIQMQKEQGGLLGEILVDRKFATELDIAQAITSQYGFPYLPLAAYDIDPEIGKSLPEALCRKFSLIPVDRIGDQLTLAMANPLNQTAINDVEAALSCRALFFVSVTQDIKNAIDNLYKKK